MQAFFFSGGRGGRGGNNLRVAFTVCVYKGEREGERERDSRVNSSKASKVQEQPGVSFALTEGNGCLDTLLPMLCQEAL